MLRGKETKKRKNRYANLIEIDEEDLYTSKVNCKGKRSVGKANKGINVEKYSRFKNIKIIKKRKEKKQKKKGKGVGGTG